MSDIPVTRGRPADGRPNRGGGAVGVGIAVAGFVTAGGGSDALATIGMGLIAVGLVVAVYHFTDARPGRGAGGRRGPSPPASLPFCPFCGRAARGRGRFCRRVGTAGKPGESHPPITNLGPASAGLHPRPWGAGGPSHTGTTR